MYAENWVYAPSVVRESDMLKKTKAQILWMHAISLLKEKARKLQ